ncbi:MAG TPA: CotH kinase family protein [Bacteroidales bacterium]|nr:CotH kinase family protein [Bacteroidales bacterium]
MCSVFRCIILLNLIFCITFCRTESEAQSVLINEFMSSNLSTIADEDGDYEDWIELCNTGEEPFNLAGCGLSDDETDPYRWVFPETVINSGGFIIIWASGKNRTNPGAPLHTNFKIDANGELLLFSSPNGVLLSNCEGVYLTSDRSYGQQPDGENNWFYFAQPTPGNPNTSQGYSEIVDPPLFSVIGGFYTNTFKLAITHPDPEVTIVYTLDGSEPMIENSGGTVFQYKNNYPEFPGDPFGEFLTGSFRSYFYTDSLVIKDRSSDPDSITCISTTFHLEPYYFPSSPVFKGTVVRAAAFKEGALSSEIITNTYFVTPLGRERYSLPVISLSLNKYDLFDYEDGVYTAGMDYDNWRLENPEAPHSWMTKANFHRSDRMWEKLAHFEYFDESDYVQTLTQDIGIRIHGNEARRRPMKSLRLYARDEYGESYFSHKFFTSNEETDFKRLILRNSGQDYYYTMFRDAYIQDLVKDLNFDTQDYAPAIVFIDGEYWGIHNLRERYDKYYFERVYGVDPENIDFISNLNEIKEGDLDHFNETLGYIEENGLVDNENYQFIQTRIDVDNFRDYQIANIFLDNHDWPGNNQDYWRLRTDEYNPAAPVGQDGRWRWVMYDMDFCFGLFGVDSAIVHNMLELATAPDGPDYPNPPWSTFLLRKFLENENFRISFINRFADLLNTNFLPDRMIASIEPFQQLIEAEVSEHILRWKNLYHFEHWKTRIETLKVFARQRPTHQRQHILDYFDLSGTYNVTLDVSNKWHGHVRINSIEISENTPGTNDNPYPWVGAYFLEIPIELEAVPAYGYAFSHWSGDIEGSDAIISITPGEDFSVKAHFVRVDTPQLIYYWLFDTSLPNDTPLVTIDPVYHLNEGALLTYHSALDGYPFDPGHPAWRKASMERRNAPTQLNYRPDGNNLIPYEEVSMRGIQIRQPFTGDGGENMMIFHLPTTGIASPTFRFAAKDEDAADNLIVEYSINSGEPVWTTSGLVNSFPALEADYQLFEFNFEDIPETFNNPDLNIRIRFSGTNMSADEGNRVTFNNFSLDGLIENSENRPPMVVGSIPHQEMIEEGEDFIVSLDEIFMDPDNDTLVFAAYCQPFEWASVSLNGSQLSISPLQRGGVNIVLLAADGITDTTEYVFSATIYPKPFVLQNNKFVFEAFSPEEPENSFPEHTIFLQSDIDDPGLNDPLPFAYFIPHDDYHEEDITNIGFPYKNTQYTRINGLGENGISFVNTGRERDLGGLLVALDTRGVFFADLNWIAQTLEENERVYAIRLFYRTTLNEDFNYLIFNNQPVEYVSGNSGEIIEFKEIPIPQFLLEQENLQLLWKYYFVHTKPGQRAMLRLDDIAIKDITYIPELEKDSISIYAYAGNLHIQFLGRKETELSLFDISGRLVEHRQVNGSGHIVLDMSPKHGIFIARIVDKEKVIVRKVWLE